MASDLLRAVPFLAMLGDDDLDRVASQTTRRHVDAGRRLFDEGDPGAHAYVIAEGELEILKRSGDRDVLLAVRGPGEVIGEIALLEDAPRMATVRARSDAVLVEIPRTVFLEVVENSSSALRAMSTALLARWKETEARLRQREQLAQLGTLAAGLTHELNNPAAAARRAAGGIVAAAEALAEAAVAFGPFERPESRRLVERIAAAEVQRLGALARSDRQEDLEDRLSGLGVTSAASAAGVLADLDAEATEEVLGELASLEPDERVAILSLGLARREIGHLAWVTLEAATRISDIVGSVKAYAFTGKAPIQEVRVETMLDDTLMLMAHRIGGIGVVREYADTPPLQAYGTELNQVWTNLIDNAVDAINEADRSPGRIVIRSRREGTRVVVEIEDDGTGVPAEVLPRVFDSFFTTKPPGSGTGLGLDISYGIVVDRHGGDISIDSEPGRTTVKVELPLDGPVG
jgi:signal transduction histidine kinase